MNRRRLLSGFAAIAGLVGGGATLAQETGADAKLQDVWEAWRSANLDATGRVIDQFQRGASHSEGQGYGMLLAATVGDRRSFEAMETWTLRNLAIRADNLMAWRWFPDEAVQVPDLNNASDGDLFRAWALLRAAQRFGVPEFRETAGQIVRDLAASCIAPHPGGPGLDPLLLPGAEGFTTEAGFIYNPCYAMPLAMTELATAFDTPSLARAARGAVEVSRALAQGGVVPDWVEMTAEGPRAAEGFSFDAGYEAMRIPLYLIWSGLSDHPAIQRYAEAQQRVSGDAVATVIARESGAALSTSSDPGYKSIAALTICAARRDVGSDIPPFSANSPYYPATLQLFAMIAQIEASPMCIPI
ncbi:endoglucanase [Pseudooceanicola antarcticus]|uniref:cellulase n=1 Tax=Pseudooceanicola antarcticus TaxID=1247613 RepID=A0A285ITT6_9RHOB|nr:glycosyl hydrolase family 8 [Pseudooceanicola antarcticus]PJE31759.1 glycosyl hydrolase family 5 [Pseudooceanicola antarcticus]SNY50351.1 endoglucanase [Pseudooceanicola antarcticus]